MISATRYREQLSGNKESIERALRILPDMIQQEHDNPQLNSPKIIKKLEKFFQIALDECSKCEEAELQVAWHRGKMEGVA